MTRSRCDRLRRQTLLGLAACFLTTSVFPARPALAWNPLQDLKREVGNCFSGGCDPIWALNRRFDQGVESKAAAMAGPFKEAFVSAMREVFANEINPFVDKLNALGLAYVEKARQFADEIENKLQGLIEKAGATAATTIAAFRTQVIEIAAKEIKAIVADVSARLDRFIEEVRCAADGAQMGAANWLRQQISIFGSWDQCWVKYGAGWWAPRADDYIRIFRIRECEIRRSLAEAKSVKDIMDGYSGLNSWARGMRCIQGAPRGSAGSLPFEQVEAETNSAYVTWMFVSSPSSRSERGVPQ